MFASRRYRASITVLCGTGAGDPDDPRSGNRPADWPAARTHAPCLVPSRAALSHRRDEKSRPHDPSTEIASAISQPDYYRNEKRGRSAWMDSFDVYTVKYIHSEISSRAVWTTDCSYFDPSSSSG